MYENDLRCKEDEYLYALAKKDELYLNTVAELQEKLSELRLKNSPILESAETPRVSLKVFLKSSLTPIARSKVVVSKTNIYC